MMALQMRDYLSGEGHYLGMDIDRAAIQWCQTHIAARDERFDFCHVDLGNPRYNPGGALSDARFRFTAPDASVDVILLKSVFTHMKPGGVQNYLSEIARLLRPGGRCLATFFLLNPVQAAWAERGKNALAFEHGVEDWRFVDPDLPEKAIAYREGYVREMLQRSGLTLVAAPYYGTWTGRPDGLSYQDILLITRE
jgi:SAM-dependent methyltransferase